MAIFKCFNHTRLLIAVSLISVFVSACENQKNGDQRNTAVGDITMARLLAQDAEPEMWLTGGRDYQQSYFSPLKDLNKKNIKHLGFAWQYEIDTTDGFEATPIVVDGVMFSSGPKGAVYSLDAKTGKERWKFEPDPIAPEVFGKIDTGSPVNRGLAVWEGSVFVASLDGHLYCLDAATGDINWKKDTISDRERGYTITGAPYVANNVVVIGNSGAELDARGYVTAYDLKTGQQRWRFFTVPGNPELGFEHPELEMAAKTWDPNSLWHVGLGGTVWDGMAYDPTLNLLYVGTGNGVPHPRKLRSPAGGDNLFLSSILALDPDTGVMAWHYQTTPADSWDYTATQKMILADLMIEGRQRQVLMQAPKNGFFYVLDRKTGELISAKPYVQVNWASHIDKTSGRPVETAQAEYFEQAKLIFPSLYGGHNWQPMSFNPDTGLVYIPSVEQPAIFAMPKEPFQYKKGGGNMTTKIVLPVSGTGAWELGGEFAKSLPSIDILSKGQPDYTVRGFLRAWDPVKQQLQWEVETSGQWVGEFFAGWNGGGVVSSAAGLVFQGLGSGELTVLDAGSGDQLHSIYVGTSIMAAPMTYSLDGEQYVAVMAGIGGSVGGNHPPGSASYKYGNQGRIVAFKLGGGPVPQRPEVVHNETETPMPPLPRRGGQKDVELGGNLFQRHCSKCHTNTGGGSVPDLRKMTRQTQNEFMSIVLQGTRADRGMGKFSEIISRHEATLIQTYLIDLAWQSYESGQQTSLPSQGHHQ